MDKDMEERPEKRPALAPANEFAICEVNQHNVAALLGVFATASAHCDFYAIDTEFSGLDRGESFRSKNVQTRYAAFKGMVDAYAVLQFGLCFLKRTAQGEWRALTFAVQVVQVSNKSSVVVVVVDNDCCKMDNFMVAPHSLIFLAEGGLELSDTFRRGIRYRIGQPSVLREIWAALAASGKPLVMHNGLTDLLFVWKSFFAPLPALYADWLYAFTETFAGGVYDTKYLAE
jgi:target of EGR1 protein 1